MPTALMRVDLFLGSFSQAREINSPRSVQNIFYFLQPGGGLHPPMAPVVLMGFPMTQVGPPDQSGTSPMDQGAAITGISYHTALLGFPQAFPPSNNSERMPVCGKCLPWPSPPSGCPHHSYSVYLYMLAYINIILLANQKKSVQKCWK